jgi:hypothetical protein
MVPILIILTFIACVGVKSLAQRVRRTFAVEERKVRRGQWILAEESFSKC